MALQLDPAVITETDLLTLHDEHPVGSEHIVPGLLPEELSTYEIPASGIVQLREKPQQQSAAVPTGTTVVQVPGGPFSEVLGSPAAGQFSVNYTNATVTFNGTDAGKIVLITYTALGSVVRSSHINNIITPLVPFFNKLDGIVPDGGTDFTFPGAVTVNGDLNVVGVMNKLAVEVLNLTDNILLLNYGLVDDGVAISSVGIEVARSVNPQGDVTHPQLLWEESSLSWNFNSTSSGPTGARAPLFTVYDKGGIMGTRLTDAQEAALVATLGAADGGLQWFNTDSSQYMGWNGSELVILG